MLKPDLFIPSLYSTQVIAGGGGTSVASPDARQSRLSEQERGSKKDHMPFVEKCWSKNSLLIKAICQNTKCLSRGRTQLQTGTKWNLLLKHSWNGDIVNQRLPVFFCKQRGCGISLVIDFFLFVLIGSKSNGHPSVSCAVWPESPYLCPRKQSKQDLAFV